MNGITVQLVFAFVGTRVPYCMHEPTPASPSRSSFNNSTASSISFSTTAQSSLRVQSANSSPCIDPSAPRPPCTTQELLNRLAAIVMSSHAMRQPSPDKVFVELSAEESTSTSPMPPPSPSPGSSRGDAAAAVATAEFKAPWLELFNYETMLPLDGAAVLNDGDVLLVLCDPDTSVELVEALQLEWLEVYSGTHRPHQMARPAASYTPTSATEMAVCTTEERLRNVEHARLALCKLVPLHMRLLEKEYEGCKATLASLAEHLQDVKSSLETCSFFNTTGAANAAAVSGNAGVGTGQRAVLNDPTSSVVERFPLLVELEPSLASVLASDSDGLRSANYEASLLMCENQMFTKQTVASRMAKQLAKLTQRAAEEEVRENTFGTSEPTRALQAYVESAVQDRDTAGCIIRSFQAEMTRQLKSVRFLVANITHLRNIIKKMQREIGAIELVLNRLSMTLQRPQLLEQSEELLRRRVVLRRAARRQLLLLQETECSDLQRDLNSFSQRREVQKLLPPKVWWYLRAPLPSLQPVEDFVATQLDHALIDRDVDAAQELVERTRFALPQISSSSCLTQPEAAQSAQEISDALLPVERLLQRAEKAEASAAAYKAQVTALELKVKEYEAMRAASSKPLDTAVTEAFHSTGAKDPLSN